MPMKRDKGGTEKNGKGSTGGQKATVGSGRSPDAAQGAAEALGEETEDAAGR
jgi:hypothetical protein